MLDIFNGVVNLVLQVLNKIEGPLGQGTVITTSFLKMSSIIVPTISEIDFLTSFFLDKKIIHKMWDSTNPRKKEQTAGQVYMAIKEDFYWAKNCVALDDAVFDYKKFNKSGWWLDCADYGVVLFKKNM